MRPPQLMRTVGPTTKRPRADGNTASSESVISARAPPRCREQDPVGVAVADQCAQPLDVHAPVDAHQPADRVDGEAEAELDARIAGTSRPAAPAARWAGRPPAAAAPRAPGPGTRPGRRRGRPRSPWRSSARRRRPRPAAGRARVPMPDGSGGSIALGGPSAAFVTENGTVIPTPSIWAVTGTPGSCAFRDTAAVSATPASCPASSTPNPCADTPGSDSRPGSSTRTPDSPKRSPPGRRPPGRAASAPSRGPVRLPAERRSAREAARR